MKKTFFVAAASAGILMLSACGEAATDTAEGETAATEEVAVEECTQEGMMAKATELGEKMQGLASDPAAMQEMATKMQEIQEKVQQGAADGSFDMAAACAAYDEMLAASE